MSTQPTTVQKSFSWSSTNLWTTILTFIFGSLALSGLELNSSPGDTAEGLVYAVTTQGWVGAIGLILTNAVNIVYHIFFVAKGSFWSFLSSRNFWINLASALIGVLVAFVPGIEIPNGTADSIVGSAYAQDWTGLVVVIFVNIVTPLIRALRDKMATVKA
jgi:hypothetical protein